MRGFEQKFSEDASALKCKIESVAVVLFILSSARLHEIPGLFAARIIFF